MMVTQAGKTRGVDSDVLRAIGSAPVGSKSVATLISLALTLGERTWPRLGKLLVDSDEWGYTDFVRVIGVIGPRLQCLSADGVIDVVSGEALLKAADRNDLLESYVPDDDRRRTLPLGAVIRRNWTAVEKLARDRGKDVRLQEVFGGLTVPEDVQTMLDAFAPSIKIRGLAKGGSVDMSIFNHRLELCKISRKARAPLPLPDIVRSGMARLDLGRSCDVDVYFPDLVPPPPLPPPKEEGEEKGGEALGDDTTTSVVPEDPEIAAMRKRIAAEVAAAPVLAMSEASAAASEVQGVSDVAHDADPDESRNGLEEDAAVRETGADDASASGVDESAVQTEPEPVPVAFPPRPAHWGPARSVTFAGDNIPMVNGPFERWGGPSVEQRAAAFTFWRRMAQVVQDDGVPEHELACRVAEALRWDGEVLEELGFYGIAFEAPTEALDEPASESAVATQTFPLAGSGKRRKVKPEEAPAMVAAWRASGQPLGVWTAAHGIDGRSLRARADSLDAIPVRSPTEVRDEPASVEPPSVQTDGGEVETASVPVPEPPVAEPVGEEATNVIAAAGPELPVVNDPLPAPSVVLQDPVPEENVHGTVKGSLRLKLATHAMRGLGRYLVAKHAWPSATHIVTAVVLAVNDRVYAPEERSRSGPGNDMKQRGLMRRVDGGGKEFVWEMLQKTCVVSTAGKGPVHPVGEEYFDEMLREAFGPRLERLERAKAAVERALGLPAVQPPATLAPEPPVVEPADDEATGAPVRDELQLIGTETAPVVTERVAPTLPTVRTPPVEAEVVVAMSREDLAALIDARIGARQEELVAAEQRGYERAMTEIPGVVDKAVREALPGVVRTLLKGILAEEFEELVDCAIERIVARLLDARAAQQEPPPAPVSEARIAEMVEEAVRRVEIPSPTLDQAVADEAVRSALARLVPDAVREVQDAMQAQVTRTADELGRVHAERLLRTEQLRKELEQAEVDERDARLRDEAAKLVAAAVAAIGTGKKA